MGNYVHVDILLDRSGSMGGVVDDTIGGFNSFLKKQKEHPGKCTISLTQFDDKYEPNYTMVPIREAGKLSAKNYQPRGSTALLDAFAKAIDSLGKRLSDMGPADCPDKVIFLVMTDGQENSSREFKKDDVKRRVEVQQSIYKWEFIFLGADLNGIADAVSFGVPQGQTYSYNSTAAGIGETYRIVSESLINSRVSGQSIGSTMDANRHALVDTK